MSEGKLDLSRPIQVLGNRERPPEAVEIRTDFKFATQLLKLGWDGTGDFRNPVIYLVWAVLEPAPGSRGQAEPVLRAVTANRERAKTYRGAILTESRQGRQVRRVRIEPRDLNHLYGHSMLKALGGEEP